MFVDKKTTTREMRLTFAVSDGLLSLPVPVQGVVREGEAGGGGGDQQQQADQPRHVCDGTKQLHSRNEILLYKSLSLIFFPFITSRLGHSKRL